MGERSLVYLKTNPDEPVFEMQEVTLGNRTGDTFTVVSGLQDGDEIVTNGTFTVDAAAQLQGKRSMMNQGNGEEEKNEMPDMKMELSETIQNALRKSLDPYLKMKDAFVDSDAKSVATYAKAALSEIQSIPESELGKMEASHTAQIKKMLIAIAENDVIENQRDHFIILNQNMVPMVKNMDGLDSKMFVQRCPMANDNKGAFWISADQQIRNPYYGEQMLSCGEVEETLE